MKQRRCTGVGAILLSVLVCSAEPGKADGVRDVELNHQKIEIQGRIIASGGGIMLVGTSPDAATALQEWLSHFQSGLAKDDLSALESLLKVRAIDHLRQTGASFYAHSQPDGSVSIEITAKDEESRNVIHQFIHSACARVVPSGRGADHPGNNLGWDAPRDTQIDK